jgi:hypothetical protein
MEDVQWSEVEFFPLLRFPPNHCCVWVCVKFVLFVTRLGVPHAPHVERQVVQLLLLVHILDVFVQGLNVLASVDKVRGWNPLGEIGWDLEGAKPGWQNAGGNRDIPWWILLVQATVLCSCISAIISSGGWPSPMLLIVQTAIMSSLLGLSRK